MAILYYKQAIACDARFLEAYNNLVGCLNLFQFVCTHTTHMHTHTHMHVCKNYSEC